MREWLKNARLTKGLTQKQMADALGITETSFSKIESGDRQKKIDLSLALRLGNVLGLPLDAIAEAEKHDSTIVKTKKGG